MLHRLISALLLTGCGAGGSRDTAGTALVADARIAPEVDAVWLVEWATEEPEVGWVEYGPGPALGRSTPRSEPTTDHSVALLGLEPGTEVSWRAHSEGPDGERISEVRTLTATALPPDLTAPYQVQGEREGWLLTSQVQGQGGPSWVVLLSEGGAPIWWRKASPGTMIVTSRLARSGELLYAEWDAAERDDVATLVRVDLEGRSATTTTLPRGHHDFYEWEDGTLGYLGFETDEALWVASDAIVELPEGAPAGTVPTTIWSWLDDWDVEPWPVCSHMLEGWRRDQRYDEWTHSNSLMVHPDGEHYLVMARYHDSLLKIRRDTGEVVWQLGGMHGDIALATGEPAWSGVGDSALFSHAHMSHAYVEPGGTDLCLAVFDNGTHREPLFSRVLEICVDETALVARVAWESQGAPYAHLMGDVRRLDDGWLVAWGDRGRIEELAGDGAVRWSAAMPNGVALGRTTPLTPPGTTP